MAKHPEHQDETTDPESQPGLTPSKIDLLNVLDNTKSGPPMKAPLRAPVAKKKPFAPHNLSEKKYGAALKSKLGVKGTKPGGSRGGRGK